MEKIYNLLRMKSLLTLVCVLSLSIITVACDEDDPPRVKLSTETMNFEFKAAEQLLEVKSEYAWSAEIFPEEAQEWCSLSLSHSLKSEKVWVHVGNNLHEGGVTADRHAVIVFSSKADGVLSQSTLHVSQGIQSEK